jgi:hypothetical protein
VQEKGESTSPQKPGLLICITANRAAAVRAAKRSQRRSPQLDERRGNDMIPAPVKQALKSRTVQYGVGIAVLSVLQGFVGFLPTNPAVQAFIGCAIASGIVILRFMTTQPVSSK